MRRWLSLLTLALAGCPAPAGNQLWIAPGGAAAALRLVDHEPLPF